MTLLERLTGMVWWPRNRDPRIRGPQPRLITVEQAEATGVMLMETLGSATDSRTILDESGAERNDSRV